MPTLPLPRGTCDISPLALAPQTSQMRRPWGGIGVLPSPEGLWAVSGGGCELPAPPWASQLPWDEGSKRLGGSDDEDLWELPAPPILGVLGGALLMMFLIMVLFSLGTGLETGGHRTRHLWSHSPGRQQPMNQEDHLWHKMGVGGTGERDL